MRNYEDFADIAKILLKYGADDNTKDSERKIALHWAAARGRKKLSQSSPETWRGCQR